MRYTKHQMRQATEKAQKKVRRSRKFTKFVIFVVGFSMGLGTLQAIELAEKYEVISYFAGLVK